MFSTLNLLNLLCEVHNWALHGSTLLPCMGLTEDSTCMRGNNRIDHCFLPAAVIFRLVGILIYICVHIRS